MIVRGRATIYGRPGLVVPPGLRLQNPEGTFMVRWPIWRMLLVLIGIRRAAVRIGANGQVIVNTVQVQ